MAKYNSGVNNVLVLFDQYGTPFIHYLHVFQLVLENGRRTGYCKILLTF